MSTVTLILAAVAAVIVALAGAYGLGRKSGADRAARRADRATIKTGRLMDAENYIDDDDPAIVERLRERSQR